MTEMKKQYYVEMTVKEISIMGRSNMCNIHTAKKTERTQEEITISGNPAKMPPYETAFVFMKEDYQDIDVPPWAIRLILDEEDLESV